MSFLVRVPGSCGELAQGMIDGERFHISCPVNLYTWGGIGRWRGVPYSPGKKVREMLHRTGIKNKPCGELPISLYSELPVGKGMASSTADLVAALALIQVLTKSSFETADQIKFLTAIEPTDGVMFQGISLFDHCRGAFQKSLGEPPPLDILALEFEEKVDTIAFNERMKKKAARSQSGRILKAFQLIEEGIKEGSTLKIGAGATISALSHQNILRKPDLEKVLKLTLELGGVGVNVAHSGTVIGMLFNPGTYSFKTLEHKIRALIRRPLFIHRLRLRGGGVDRIHVSSGVRS
ncbi:MAG: GHMP kinase [Nitrospirae bacterium]|nr:GHMP kinase [Nitrospirota bacterium]